MSHREAHEIFAGIYKRFEQPRHLRREQPGCADSTSRSQADWADAGAVADGDSPPELAGRAVGLLYFIEPTGTLLGSFPTFKTLFCEKKDGRRLVPEQGSELKRRLGAVVQRTLRRQAQEFLDKPFVGRRAELYEYSMSPRKRSCMTMSRPIS